MLDHLSLEILHQIGWQLKIWENVDNFLKMHPRVLQVLNTPYFWKPSFWQIVFCSVNGSVDFIDLKELEKVDFGKYALMETRLNNCIKMKISKCIIWIFANGKMKINGRSQNECENAYKYITRP